MNTIAGVNILRVVVGEIQLSLHFSFQWSTRVKERVIGGQFSSLFQWFPTCGPRTHTEANEVRVKVSHSQHLV